PGELGQAESAVTVVVVGAVADESLAEAILADDGPRGALDGVLGLTPPGAEFRAALRSGRQRVELPESASVEVFARKLAAWRPVIAARRAIMSMTDLVRADHPLRGAVERTRGEAHEIKELDLVDELERGESRLLRGAGGGVVDAGRLLGGDGGGPP